ncbi:MAG: hypothetical protein AAGL10_11570 [Pseudomonadota bacterium]
MKLLYFLAIAAGAVSLATPSVFAQDNRSDGSQLSNSPLVGQLRGCTQISNDAQRLACFDREVGAFVGATTKGDVKVVEAEQITDARKKLYGYSIPDAGVFEAATDEDKEKNKRLTSTITRVRKVGRNEWHFWIEEGNAKWRFKNNSIRVRAPEVGQTVEFRPASMGTYWIRIEGRKGVRGNRIG